MTALASGDRETRLRERLASRVPDPREIPFVGRFLRWLRLDFAGVIGATFFLCLSLTPSLLPRTWIFQAVVSGLTATIGYAIGALVGSIVRFVKNRIRPNWSLPRRVVVYAWTTYGVAGMAAVIWYLVSSARWQTQIRSLMGDTPPGPNHYLFVFLIAASIFLGFIVVGRIFRAAFRRLGRAFARWVPIPVAVLASAACIGAISYQSWTGLLYPGLLGFANDTFAAVNRETEAGNSAPTSATHSGGPGSLVTWDSLGRKGREFVSSGPTVNDLEAFSGQPALDPVRAYVGLHSADTPQDLAELATDELERSGGFEREVLVVVTTTGTGWVDAAAADALEYLHNGDSAIVTMQYSYIPSWLSFVADQEQVKIAGKALFDEVYERWSQLPEEERPELFAYGESLGGLGSGAAFDDVTDLEEKVDGALWVGTPVNQDLREFLTLNRDTGSPARLPVFDGGERVRFWGGWQEPLDLDRTWTEPRILYLQHASDPVAFWDPSLIYSQPAWLKEPPGPDVLPAFDWYPFVTFWQITADMAVSAQVPAGHAHNYGGELVDAWMAVAKPTSPWSEAKLAQLRDMVYSFDDE